MSSYRRPQEMSTGATIGIIVVLIIIASVAVYLTMFRKTEGGTCVIDKKEDIVKGGIYKYDEDLECVMTDCVDGKVMSEGKCVTTAEISANDILENPIKSGNDILGIPIKPGNEILDFINETDDEMKPLVHSAICSLISKIKNVINETLSTQTIKCSEIKKVMDKQSNDFMNDSPESNEFMVKHELFKIIKEKFDVYSKKLYGRYCASDEDKITKDDVVKFLGEFETHMCDNVENVDIEMFSLNGIFPFIKDNEDEKKEGIKDNEDEKKEGIKNYIK
jgi:hypothetical protein